MPKNRHYEIVILVHPDQSGQIPDLLNHYQEIIKKQGGRMNRLEDWGKRTLAYPIKKLSKAHYILMNIECGNDAVAELSHDFRYNTAVLRNLILKRNLAITDISPMLTMIKTQAEMASQPQHQPSQTITPTTIPASEIVPEIEGNQAQ